MADNTIQRLLVELGVQDNLTKPLENMVGNFKYIDNIATKTFKDGNDKLTQFSVTSRDFNDITKKTNVIFDSMGTTLKRSDEFSQKLQTDWNGIRFQFLSAGLLAMQLSRQFDTLNSIGKKMTTEIGFTVLQYSLLTGQLPALMFLTDAQIALGEAISSLPQPIQDVLGAVTVFGETALQYASQIALLAFGLPQIMQLMPSFKVAWNEILSVVGLLPAGLKTAETEMSGILTSVGGLEEGEVLALSGVTTGISEVGIAAKRTSPIISAATGVWGAAFVGVAAAALLAGAIISDAWPAIMESIKLNNKAELDAMSGHWDAYHADVIASDIVFWDGLKNSTQNIFNQIGEAIISGIAHIGKAIVDTAVWIAKTVAHLLSSAGLTSQANDLEKWAISTSKDAQDFMNNMSVGMFGFNQATKQSQMSSEFSNLVKGGVPLSTIAMAFKDMNPNMTVQQFSDLGSSSGVGLQDLISAWNTVIMAQNAANNPTTINNTVNINGAVGDTQSTVDKIITALNQMQYQQSNSLKA